MARINGVTKPPNLFARVVFWFSKRMVGRVPLPIRIHAHHPKIFGGMARMELAQDKAKRIPFEVKAIAQIRIATRIGCPF
jgi:hypothetical protein